MLRRLLDAARRLVERGARRGVGAAQDTISMARAAGVELGRILFGDTLFNEFAIASLTLLSTITVLGDLVFPAGSRQAASIYTVDLAICAVLAAEYARRVYASRDRRAFLSKYWYEPLAFIPAYATSWASGGLAALLRLLRLVRVYRVARLLGRGNVYVRIIVEVAREARLIQLTVTFLIGLGFTSVLTFMAEARSPESQIQSIADAFWWSLATVTTVGYGDMVPATAAGKAIGVALMIFGIVLLGGFISLASASVVRIYDKYYHGTRGDGRLERLRSLAEKAPDLTPGEVEEMISIIKRIAAERGILAAEGNSSVEGSRS